MKNRPIISRWIVLTLALLASFAAVLPSAGTRVALADNGATVHDYTVMFTKWITTLPNMEGILTGGDAGSGTFTGVVLNVTKGNLPQVWQAEVLYHIHGANGRSFDANIDVTENDVINEATLEGVITNGWLQGGRVQGGYNIISSCPENPHQPPDPLSLCYQVTLHIHVGS